jgi:predicted translin family RNA/ssDNA-binding protein
MEKYFEKVVAFYEYPAGFTPKFESKVEITKQNFEEQRAEIIRNLQSTLFKIIFCNIFF